jgi:hypothetical protein
MRRILLALAGALALVLTLSATALADDDSFKVRHSGSTDSGTCGNDWANDTFTRVFNVENADGTTYLREDFKNGRFVTVAGSSPGACQPTPNGHLVANDVEGTFHGFIAGAVTGGTFNPEATCLQPCNGDNFVASFFGAGATWNANTFKFEYEAHGHDLIGRHWQNASPDQGGNQGDIYTS